MNTTWISNTRGPEKKMEIRIEIHLMDQKNQAPYRVRFNGLRLHVQVPDLYRQVVPGDHVAARI